MISRLSNYIYTIAAYSSICHWCQTREIWLNERAHSHWAEFVVFKRPHSCYIVKAAQPRSNQVVHFDYWKRVEAEWDLKRLTLSLLSSKSTFSQTFKEKCISEVARVDSIIIFHLSKATKSQVLHTVWCYIFGEAAGEIWHWSLLGIKIWMLDLHSLGSCCWPQVIHYDPFQITTSKAERKKNANWDSQWNRIGRRCANANHIQFVFKMVHISSVVKFIAGREPAGLHDDETSMKLFLIFKWQVRERMTVGNCFLSTLGLQ